MQEDFLLFEKVNHEMVKKLIKLMKTKNIDCLKIGDEAIVNDWPINRTEKHKTMSLIDVPTNYKFYLSHQPISIFKRQILLDCLIPNEDP